MSNLTLITAFYDLNKLEERPSYKSKENYMKWADFLFKLNVNIVFFVEKVDYSYIWAQRRKNNLSAKTLVISRSFKKNPFYHFKKELACYLFENPITNATIKDTTNYLPLTWSKIFFVEEIVNLNPFKTPFFGWIDFGIYSTSIYDLPKMDDYSQLFIQDENNKKIRILELRKIIKEEIEDIHVYTSLFRWKIAGGLWTGHKTYIDQFINLFKENLFMLLANRIAAHEEAIFGILFYYHRSIFEPYYGNYYQILVNYPKIQKPDDLIIWNIKFANSHKLFKDAIIICNRLIKDCFKKLSAEQRFIIFDQLIIAYFYVDKSKCSYYVERWIYILKKDKEQYPFFLENKNRIFNNIKFLDGCKEYLDQMEKIIRK